MDDILRVAGIAIAAVLASMLLKGQYRAAGVACILSAFLIISVFSFENGVGEAISEVRAFTEGTGFSGYAVTLVKALGIAYITQMTEAVCRETGEETVAMAVEFAGRTQLILLALPLAAELLEIAAGLL